MDFGTGMWAGLGVLSALHQRSDTGDGCHVSTSLMDTALGWVSYHLMGHMADGQIPGPMGSRFAMIAPYGAFPTNDGQLMIAAGSDALFGRLCAAFDLPELSGDPLYASNPSRVENRDKLFTILTAKTRQYGTQELWELMGANSVPAAPIQDMAAVVSDPQVAASGMLPAVDHPSIPNYRDVAIPVQWNNERPRTRTVPPRAGEHTREVLTEIGYSSDEIEGLLGDGIVIG